jgi:hypothetical protein
MLRPAISNTQWQDGRCPLHSFPQEMVWIRQSILTFQPLVTDG